MRRSETQRRRPQPVICRIALPSASAAPVSRDQTPAQASASRAVGTAAAWTSGHSRRAITGMTRAWNLVPAEARSPTTSDHTCASHKTSIDTNVLPVKVRASAPASNVAPTTDATRNDPYTAAQLRSLLLLRLTLDIAAKR